MTKDMPNISAPHLDTPDLQKLEPHMVSAHAPRILLLYGSLRPTSYSRLLTLEAECILQQWWKQWKRRRRLPSGQRWHGLPDFEADGRLCLGLLSESEWHRLDGSGRHCRTFRRDCFEQRPADSCPCRHPPPLLSLREALAWGKSTF